MRAAWLTDLEPSFEDRFPYEPGRYEPGRYEPGRYEPGRYEPALGELPGTALPTPGSRISRAS